MTPKGSKDPEAGRKAAADDATTEPEPVAAPASRGPSLADVMLLKRDPALTEDASSVGLIEEWRAVRARVRLHYADGSTSTAEDLFRMLGEMRSLEGRIACFRPMSFLGVRWVLSMASDILAERMRKEDGILGDGPVLELVCRAHAALGDSEGGIP